MTVAFKDYYKTLNVARDATQDEIQRSYRKLARKYHPDLNKDSGAEEKFKEINEAYEVLRDPAKREKYDQLGSGWRQDQEFQPPPGWEFNFDFGSRRQGGPETFFWTSEPGGFSDFFETLFGGDFGEARHEPAAGRSYTVSRPGADHEATLRISLEDAFRGGIKTITLQTAGPASDGRISPAEKRYDVKIPPGILPGQKIRLSGQGAKGTGGGASGHLYLKVEIAPHPRFRLAGRDLYITLPVTPWEAALGTHVTIPTLAGPLTLMVPPGTPSGKKLRLKAKGMPNPKGPPGDLYAVVQIEIPKNLLPQERQLFQELSRVSTFNPRT
ncbi:MAG: DnaJ domain-containing protein [Desulfobacterales bacterium]|nr:MAG: DnaJ domain-containing protein [Desulfobacterales bacterium]